jgi:hypothetical protein
VKRRLLYAGLTASAVWLLLGLVGTAVFVGFESDLGYGAVMGPAFPLYLLSAKLNGSAVTRGVFWDSAHSPPFLNPLGLVAVYALPSILGLVYCGRRLRHGGARGEAPHA